MSEGFSDAELEAYLDEGLDPKRAMELEQAIRSDDELLYRLSNINGRRDAGIHTLGEIWRRNQIGVPSEEQVANYLLGVSPREEADYIRFRIDVLKCPYTAAMVADLTVRNEGSDEEQVQQRRRKYYNSSAGLLRGKKRESGD